MKRTLLSIFALLVAVFTLQPAAAHAVPEPVGTSLSLSADATVPFNHVHEASVTLSVDGSNGGNLQGAISLYSSNAQGDLVRAIGFDVVDQGDGDALPYTWSPSLLLSEEVGTHYLIAEFHPYGHGYAMTRSNLVSYEVVPAAPEGCWRSPVDWDACWEDIPTTVTVGASFEARFDAMVFAHVAPPGRATVTFNGHEYEQQITGTATSFPFDTFGMEAGDYPIDMTYHSSDERFADVSITRTVTLAYPTMDTLTRVTLAASERPESLFDMHVSVCPNNEGRCGGGTRPTGNVTATSATGPTITGTVSNGSGTLSVPQSIAEGTHTYTVTFDGEVRDARWYTPSSGEVTFTVDRGQGGHGGAQLQVGQPSVAEGGTQTLVVTGLGEGEIGHVFLYSTPQFLGSVTADGSGTATFTFRVPAGLAPGQHRIELRTDAAISSAFMTVLAPPAGGAGGSGGAAAVVAAGGAGDARAQVTRLAATGGSDAGLPVGVLAGLLLAAGAGVLLARRSTTVR